MEPARNIPPATQFSADQHVQMARIFMEEKEWELAVGHAIAAIKQDNTCSEGFHVLGLANIRLGKLPDAFEALTRAVRLKPEHTSWLLALGHVSMQLKRYDIAYSIYEAMIPNLPPVRDPQFDPIYLRGMVRVGNPPFPVKRRERFALLFETIRSTQGVAGAVAECGCFLGLSAYMQLSALALEKPDYAGEHFFILDSFEGLSEPRPEDAIPVSDPHHAKLSSMMKPGYFAAALEKVQQHLSDFPRVTYIKGWIPESLAQLPEQSYRFVNLDVDLYEPYAGALPYFYTRLSKGGIIMCDDYGWPGGKKAIDEFCVQAGITPIITPFDQAIINK